MPSRRYENPVVGLELCRSHASRRHSQRNRKRTFEGQIPLNAETYNFLFVDTERILYNRSARYDSRSLPTHWHLAVYKTADGCTRPLILTAARRVGRAASEGTIEEVGLICLRQFWVALAFVDK